MATDKKVAATTSAAAPAKAQVPAAFIHTVNTVMNGQCWHILASGQVSLVPNPTEKKGFKLSELQTFVGGYIDYVKPNRDLVMIVNDEGLMKCNRNDLATQIYQKYVDPSGFIHGDVLVCPAKFAR